MPPSPRSCAARHTADRLSPAPAVIMFPSQEMPPSLFPIWITQPRKPFPLKSTLLPLPRMKYGTPPLRQAQMTALSASSPDGSQNRSHFPPIFMEVYGATIAPRSNGEPLSLHIVSIAE